MGFFLDLALLTIVSPRLMMGLCGSILSSSINALYGYNIYFSHSVDEHSIIHDWAFPLMPNVPTCVRNVGIGFLATGYGYAPMTFLMLIYSLIHCDQKKSSIGFQSLIFFKTLRY